MLNRIIVAGGRVGVPRAAVEAVLDRLSQSWPKGTVVVHGNARGTDSFAGQWASDRGWAVDSTPITEALDGPKEDAPKRRNARMLAKGAEAVIAFPGGPGTRHMIEIADAKGLTIYDVELEGPAFKVWRWGTGKQEKAICVAHGGFDCPG